LTDGASIDAGTKGMFFGRQIEIKGKIQVVKITRRNDKLLYIQMLNPNGVKIGEIGKPCYSADSTEQTF
jgi:hypothetical protein